MTRRLWIAAVAALAALAGAPAVAEADSARVVLVAPGPALADAVSTALEPWGVAVDVAPAGSLGDALPGAARRARTLARRRQADAVAWISTNADGAAVWIYDARSDDVVARPLAVAPPLDPAHAAAVALTLKTLLRKSRAAPPPPTSTAPARSVGIDSAAAVRARPGAGVPVEPRLALTALWGSGWLVAIAGASAGPGIRVDEVRFVGRYTDTTGIVGARVQTRAGRLALAGQAAAALHVTALDGALPDADRRVHIRRVNPAVSLGASVAVAIAPEAELGLRVGGDLLLRTQRYLVAGDPVLALPLVEVDAAVWLAVRFL
ncbi:MAG: hypothetical protein D6689_04335 [Deltaproteobacteria bacterium]|nr:MAG: hypothetical protein D6689_04335 [Deltaproteobacteria bacterium]